MDDKEKAYEKKLQLERIELMRLKQGVQEEAELVVPEEKIEVNYTKKEKVDNFFYHYKALTIACICIAALVAFFIYDIATTVHSDITVMIISPAAGFYETDLLKATLEELTTDINGDGRVDVGISHTPLGDPNAPGADPQMYQANFARFAGEMQLNNSLLMIADEEVMARADMGGIMLDLTSLYPDNPNVKPNGFYIKGTEFAKKLELGEVPDTLFIGVRSIVGKANEKEQLVYDTGIEMLKQLIEQG